MPRTPEEEARVRIDAQLADCGWVVQDASKADFSAARGHQLFANDLPQLLDELNEVLAA